MEKDSSRTWIQKYKIQFLTHHAGQNKEKKDETIPVSSDPALPCTSGRIANWHTILRDNSQIVLKALSRCLALNSSVKQQNSIRSSWWAWKVKLLPFQWCCLLGFCLQQRRGAGKEGTCGGGERGGMTHPQLPGVTSVLPAAVWTAWWEKWERWFCWREEKKRACSKSLSFWWEMRRMWVTVGIYRAKVFFCFFFVFWFFLDRGFLNNWKCCRGYWR